MQNKHLLSDKRSTLFRLWPFAKTPGFISSFKDGTNDSFRVGYTKQSVKSRRTVFRWEMCSIVLRIVEAIKWREKGRAFIFSEVAMLMDFLERPLVFDEEVSN
ncbi:hypothetical protein WA026_010615 [Henosepilachna vigintioctopunctata]|uniref:Uncharacterized protein n=1 Tax=Henosepilachna vigintioctopunctata TaxID=420089 RepID=A0AAW1V5K7_9CUCU